MYQLHLLCSVEKPSQNLLFLKQYTNVSTKSTRMTLSYKSQRYIKLNKHTHIYNGRDGEEPPQKIRKKREGIERTSKHNYNKERSTIKRKERGRELASPTKAKRGWTKNENKDNTNMNTTRHQNSTVLSPRWLKSFSAAQGMMVVQTQWGQEPQRRPLHHCLRMFASREGNFEV